MERVRKFVGEKCYLTPCIREDAEQWVEWLNDYEVALLYGPASFRPPSLEDAIRSYEQDSPPEVHAFTICSLEDDAPIGKCWLEGISHLHRRAMLDIYIGSKSHWGTGCGTDAVRLLVDYAFSALSLRTILLDTVEFNERALACYRKVGFKEMGRWRKARVVDGEAYDLVFLDIVAEEFEGYAVRELTRQVIQSQTVGTGAGDLKVE